MSDQKMTAGEFRKKPVVIQAEQFWSAVKPLPFADQKVCCFDGKWWYVQTLEGPLHISEGDWIIRGVKGEFYPCKPDIFAATYEPAALSLQAEAEAVAWMCGNCERVYRSEDIDVNEGPEDYAHNQDGHSFSPVPLFTSPQPVGGPEPWQPRTACPPEASPCGTCADKKWRSFQTLLTVCDDCGCVIGWDNAQQASEGERR